MASPPSCDQPKHGVTAKEDEADYAAFWNHLRKCGGAHPSWTYALRPRPERLPTAPRFGTPAVIQVIYRGPKRYSPAKMGIRVTRYGGAVLDDDDDVMYILAMIAHIEPAPGRPNATGEDFGPGTPDAREFFFTLAVWEAYVEFLASHQIDMLSSSISDIHPCRRKPAAVRFICQFDVTPRLDQPYGDVDAQTGLARTLIASLTPLRYLGNALAIVEDNHALLLDALPLTLFDWATFVLRILRRNKRRLDRIYLIDDGETLKGDDPIPADHVKLMQHGVDALKTIIDVWRPGLQPLDEVRNGLLTELIVITLTAFHVCSRHNPAGCWQVPWLEYYLSGCNASMCPCWLFRQLGCLPLLLPPAWFTAGNEVWQALLAYIAINEGLRDLRDPLLDLPLLCDTLLACQMRRPPRGDAYISHDYDELRRQEIALGLHAAQGGLNRGDMGIGNMILFSRLSLTNLPGRIYRSRTAQQLADGAPSILEANTGNVAVVSEADFLCEADIG